MVLGATNQGGRLVICDPHGHKADSLLRRVSPLQGALLPGTTLAIEHGAIMTNVEVVKTELERRVAGGDGSVPIFLVIEELNRLQRDKATARSLTEILETIGQEGRGFNIFCIIGAQKITGLPQIRKAVIAFIVHRVDVTEAQLCIPMRYARYASELAPGQSFVKDADGITEPLMQVTVTVEDFEAARVRLAMQQRTVQRYPRTTAPATAAPPAGPAVSHRASPASRKEAIPNQSGHHLAPEAARSATDALAETATIPAVPDWKDNVLVPEAEVNQLWLKTRTDAPVSPDAPTELETIPALCSRSAEPITHEKLDQFAKRRKARRN
jgi:hypothetical protein